MRTYRNRAKDSGAIASAIRGKLITGSRYFTPTDGRAQKCYRWEDAVSRWAGGAFLESNKPVSRDVAKGLARLMAKVAIKKLAAKHNLSEERQAQIRGDFHAIFSKEHNRFCFGGLGGVYFAEWGWRPWIIAHEVAHWADHWEREFTKVRQTGHSAEWLGWFAFLLIDVVKVDAAKLAESLKAAKLRFTLP